MAFPGLLFCCAATRCLSELPCVLSSKIVGGVKELEMAKKVDGNVLFLILFPDFILSRVSF